MNKSALLLAVGSAFVFGLPVVASAYDDDSDFGVRRPWFGAGARGVTREDLLNGGVNRLLEPIFYRPTMRYYGKGYTVSYRYVPIYYYEAGSSVQNVSTNFRTEAFRIATADIPAWGAKSPRMVVANRKAPSQSGVTSITRSKPAPSYSAPASLPVPSAPLPVPAVPLPTPNLDPAAPIPLPPDAPKP